MDAVKVDSKISWIIAVACAGMNLLILSPLKVSGLFFVEILDRYHVGRNVAGYPAFIMTLIRCSGGPFAGYFAARFGVNEVMILGSVLSAVGISACFFAEDIASVIVFFGIIHGFGVALTNTFLPIIIKQHFKKHITLAFGVTQAGGPIGAFFTTPLFVWIFQSYGTSGGFLLIGAIVINSLPIALVLYVSSPDKFHSKSDHTLKFKECPEEHLKSVENTVVSSSVGKDDNMAYNPMGEFDTGEVNIVSVFKNDSPTYDHTENKQGEIDDGKLNDLQEQNVSVTSVVEVGKSKSRETEKNRMGDHKVTSKIQPKNNIQERNPDVSTTIKINDLENQFKGLNPVAEIPEKLDPNVCETNFKYPNDCTNSNSKINQIEKNPTDLSKYQAFTEKDCIHFNKSNCDGQPYSPDNFVSTSYYAVDCGNNQGQLTAKSGKDFIPSIDDENGRSTKSTLDAMEQSNPIANRKEEHKMQRKLTFQSHAKTKMINDSLMLFFDVTYWILMTSSALQIFILMLFWITMIDFSRDKSIDNSYEVYLLMILPIGEIIGRLGLGWITDGNYLTPINFCILCYIGMGCTCSLMALAQGFYVAFASIFIFSIVTSGLTIVIPMVIFEIYDSDKHSMGQASKFLLFGPLSFLNGPIIGYFRGTLGSYIWLYHSMAMMLVACAVLTASIPILIRWRNQKKSRS